MKKDPSSHLVASCGVLSYQARGKWPKKGNRGWRCSSGLEATFRESPFDPQRWGLRGRSGKLSRQASVLLGDHIRA